MRETLIADTGLLVGFVRRDDQHHDWAVEQFKLFSPPLLTCEVCIAEACFLVRDLTNGARRIFDLFDLRAVVLDFDLQNEWVSVLQIMEKYRDLPASLADACLVRMAEMHRDARVLTVDRHFGVYRKNDRRVIPLVHPRW